MLRSFLLTLSAAFLFSSVNAQVTFILDSIPDYTPEGDLIYIAGDFNGWNPGDPQFALEKNEDSLWQITLGPEPEGTTYLYKFTRGSWETVEKGPQGEEIANRVFVFGNDSTVHQIVYNWADGSGGGGSTAAWNVQVMNDHFYMPQLDRYRRIWLYLPPDYEENTKSYPVLYMHDGQNLFDAQTSYAGEWEVDETLNDLADQGYSVPFVVGIDNGGTLRIDELTPWYNPQYGGGEGDEYLAFIVETLKPYIDQHYRTVPGRENTGIMGSSLGGLISLYGAVKYQEVFGKSGDFSPAYWINRDSIFRYVSQTGKKQDVRFYQNAGEHEGNDYIVMMYEMEDTLKSVGFEHVTSKTIPGGQHNEQTWRDDFANAYLWLFASYALGVPENQAYQPLAFHPNPVSDELILKDADSGMISSVRISDTAGKVVLNRPNLKGNRIGVQSLAKGLYIIRVENRKGVFVGKFVKR
ncbi:MAG: T9SS type A sorting domain-containing protein [Acidobacteria bacterium]|nr:T9SS type A sorting domain-containing protein [Acidobacteriota bacterium]